jgi:hypothetical protein
LNSYKIQYKKIIERGKILAWYRNFNKKWQGKTKIIINIATLGLLVKNNNIPHNCKTLGQNLKEAVMVVIVW